MMTWFNYVTEFLNLIYVCFHVQKLPNARPKWSSNVQLLTYYGFETWAELRKHESKQAIRPSMGCQTQIVAL
jgi:hypothetical protein